MSEIELYVCKQMTYVKLNCKKYYRSIKPVHWPNGSSVRQWSGRLGHTKDFKNGT